MIQNLLVQNISKEYKKCQISGPVSEEPTPEILAIEKEIDEKGFENVGEPVTDIPGPGKFQGNASLSVAEALHSLCQDSWFNDQFGSVQENGVWEALFINVTVSDRARSYIVTEDDQGFFTYKEFDSEEEARKQYTTDLEKYIVEDMEELLK